MNAGEQIVPESANEVIAAPSRDRLGRRLWRWGLLLILLDLLVGGTILGVEVRRWAWDYTQPARFRFDVNRNYRFGLQALEEGYWNLYENQVITNPPQETKINYPPLRLALFEGWAAFNRWAFPDTYQQWQESFAFNGFLMYYNTTIEWLAAIAAFLIVRHWIWRTGPPANLPTMTRLDRLLYGSTRATIAFLMVWFSPAMIISAHGWPSSDMWVIPFFLWAVLLASWEKWFLAGIVFGIGTMFKGQQLFIAPLFVLWPLFAGEGGRALRGFSGFLLALAIVLSGWMLTTPADQDVTTKARLIDYPAILWIISIAGAVVIANLYRWLPDRRRWITVPLFVIAAAMVIWPAFGRPTADLLILAALAVCLIAAARWAPLRSQGFALAAVTSFATLLCIVFFHGSTAWFKLGFLYSTERHPSMIVGPGSNLPAILHDRFNWFAPDMIAWVMPEHFFSFWPADPIAVSIRTVLFLIFAAMAVTSCIAVARQWRANDRRFLVAVIVPWLLLYTIPAQMHERYLLFAATCGAIVIGISVGAAAVMIFLTLLTFVQTTHSMMSANQLQYHMGHPFFNTDFHNFGESIKPEIGWAVVAITGVFFVSAFTRSHWRRPADTAKSEEAGPSGPASQSHP